MREILFRGKRVDNGEWVHGGYMAYDFDSPFGEMVPRSNIVSYEEGDGNGFWFEVAPETVGQYTGLTDQNGTKIFEGDICRVTRLCVLEYGKITFKNGCFWFESFGVAGMLRMCDISINGFEIEVTATSTTTRSC